MNRLLPIPYSNRPPPRRATAWIRARFAAACLSFGLALLLGAESALAQSSTVDTLAYANNGGNGVVIEFSTGLTRPNSGSFAAGSFSVTDDSNVRYCCSNTSNRGFGGGNPPIAVWVATSTTIAGGATITVSYTAPTNVNLVIPVRGADGQPLASFTRAVVVDYAAPTVDGAVTSSDGTRIILDFNEALRAAARGGQPQANAFTVTVGMSTQTPSTVQIDEDKVVLTLGTRVQYGQTVKVAYTNP